MRTLDQKEGNKPPQACFGVCKHRFRTFNCVNAEKNKFYLVWRVPSEVYFSGQLDDFLKMYELLISFKVIHQSNQNLD